MRRFKINAGTIEDSAYVISGPDAQHMINVLRLKAGDQVVLFDGTGWEYAATIRAISRGEVQLAVLNSQPGLAESPARITVAQGFLKDKKMDTLIRQLTELGISRWVPFCGVRSVARPDAARLAKRTSRWRKIATEALKQCRRSQPPTIEPAVDFNTMLELAASAAVKLICWEAAAAPLRDAIPGAMPKGEVFIILGPEGGFAENEIEQACRSGFQTVSLGPRILRAETATLAAGALVQFLFGDLGDGQG